MEGDVVVDERGGAGLEVVDGVERRGEVGARGVDGEGDGPAPALHQRRQVVQEAVVGVRRVGDGLPAAEALGRRHVVVEHPEVALLGQVVARRLVVAVHDVLERRGRRRRGVGCRLGGGDVERRRRGVPRGVGASLPRARSPRVARHRPVAWKSQGRRERPVRGRVEIGRPIKNGADGLVEVLGGGRG